MDAKELRKQLDTIAQEEYGKICDKYPVYGGRVSGIHIEAFSILNTPLLGIEYWHRDNGSGYCFSTKTIKLDSYKHNQYRYFNTMEELENFIKKTKIKCFKNIFDFTIEESYGGWGDVNQLPDYILNQIEIPVLLKKTTIINYSNKVAF